MDNNQIILHLLTTGIYNKSQIINLNEINTILRQIHFEVVEWYDKSVYILKNTSNKDIILGYDENENKEIINIFEKIVCKKEVKSDLIHSLVQNNWLEYVKNELILSKRCLVIFKNEILEFKGRYVLCCICNFLVDGKEMHEYCKNIMDEKNCNY
ncbi:hypothetical protein NAPIS_ORF00552 [Vairimorpha apis BRL 01]|uniref:Uncharacterized protein n=1 Tax=Vairimorpha apis BRL 01 TaxID=1037528 RepID=T0L2V1_9MICR|nr:hypothetical protein NAPIS_ORF00552 [Vairimorpha apis BRL 01]